MAALSAAAAESAEAQRGGRRSNTSGPQAATADTLLRFALERAQAGDTTGAIRALERATRVAPNYAPAYFERGVLLSRTTELGMGDILRRREAAQHINRALELDPGNPFYLLELGRIRLKTPLLRLDAERMFKRALESANLRGDPVVIAEVNYELGNVHERRYATQANRHLIVGSQYSFDPNAALQDWRYTQNFLAQYAQGLPDAGEIDFRQAEDHYRAALASDSTHERAAEGLLGLLSEARRYEEMMNTARALAPAQPGSARRLMAMGLALHRLDRDAEAEPVFDSALALVPPIERRQMTGLATILREDRALAYDSSTAAARTALDSLFWDAADPLKLTPANESRIEFLARVAFADLRFSSEFGDAGWRTDRGITHIRYGEPTRVATFAPETGETVGAENTVGRVTTVWYYQPGNRYFVFTGPPAMSTAWFAGEFRAYAEDQREIAPVRFDNVTTALRVDSVPVQVARFRGAQGAGATDVAFYADVPAGRLLRDVDVTQASIETAFFLSDGTRRSFDAARDTAVVRTGNAPARTARTLPRAWERALAPGEYVYRVEARQGSSGNNARGLSSVLVEPFAAGTFAISDVLIARRIVPRALAAGAAPRGRADFDIAPNPAQSFARGDTLFLYWEEYGHARDSATASGRARVDLSLRLTDVARAGQVGTRILGGIADAIGLSAKGDDRVGLRFERSVSITPDDRVANYLALDIGDAPAGTYELDLTVTDLVSGARATRTRTITVPRP